MEGGNPGDLPCFDVNGGGTPGNLPCLYLNGGGEPWGSTMLNINNGGKNPGSCPACTRKQTSVSVQRIKGIFYMVYQCYNACNKK